MVQSENTAVSDWLNGFFSSYYRHRPVNATFIGVHDLDHRLPDYSEAGTGDVLADTTRLLDQAGTLRPQSLWERIDLRLATGYLRIQEWEYRSGHFHRGNPSLYTGEAIFGVMSLFLSAFAPLADRVASATARLEAVPGLLAQGRRNVRAAPTAWTERALRECDGALAFLTEGIDQLTAQERLDAPELRRAADRAAAAFADFTTWLRTELLHHPSDQTGCGEDALALYLTEGHCIDISPGEVARQAEVQLEEATRYLSDHAPDFGAADAASVLQRMASQHPGTAGYYACYEEQWKQVREAAERHELLTWPDFPIRFVPRPVWARRAAPDLYFLYYRSPAAYHRPAVHEYLVTPIDDTMPPARQRELLEANNDSTIRLNHVIHHGGIGHHVQNWHAFRSPSRIGQVAAVDCASRIAMPCGGTMAEGWACYATDLMAEVGFLTPEEQFAEWHTRARMGARAVVDVRLHQGEFTLEQAAGYYQRHAGMAPSSAMAEAVKNSMFPGMAVIYQVGTEGIQRLRADLAAQLGPRFSLRAFHDELLSFGSIPVNLIGAEMRRRSADAER
jgi:hypothetical protein